MDVLSPQRNFKKINNENLEESVAPPARVVLPLPRKKNRARRFFFLLVILFVFFAAASFAAYYFYKQNQALKDPKKVAEIEAQTVINQVGKLIVLPENETPTVATIKDPEKLKDQLFFAKAKVGDKMLIYTNAKKAILYDPVINKIVEVASLNLDLPQ